MYFLVRSFVSRVWLIMFTFWKSCTRYKIQPFFILERPCLWPCAMFECNYPCSIYLAVTGFQNMLFGDRGIHFSYYITVTWNISSWTFYLKCKGLTNKQSQQLVHKKWKSVSTATGEFCGTTVWNKRADSSRVRFFLRLSFLTYYLGTIIF